MVQVSLLGSLYQILKDRNTEGRIDGPKEASGFSNSTAKNIPERIENRYSNYSLCINVHSSTIHTSQKVTA